MRRGLVVLLLATAGRAAPLLLAAASLVRAAPPLDLTDLEADPKRRTRQVQPRLQDKDLIYTDNLSKNDPALKSTAVFTGDAYGRSGPSEQAKPLLRFRKDFRVKILGQSRDKQWVAVELLSGTRRAWVPKSAFLAPKTP